MELQNLNKENFFDALYEAYPKAMKEFCDWIDSYKKETNWNSLFGDKIKYHHLPIEMQIGIWIEFQFSLGMDDITFGCDYKYSENIWEWFSESLRDREINLNN